MLLLANGELRKPAGVKALARRVMGVLCADGGARHALALGLTPRWVVGDMDSLPRKFPKTWGQTSFICVPDQDFGDLHKALAFARRVGARRVYAAGVLGGTLDHELVNLAVLEEARGLEIVLIDTGEARLLGPGVHRPALPKGRRFSLLAAPRATVSLSGARYGLHREVLRRGSRGLGNRSAGGVVMRVSAGRVWLVS